MTLQILPVHTEIAELMARLRVANPAHHDSVARAVVDALREILIAEDTLAIANAAAFAKLSDHSALPDLPAST
jgi:plasmid stability protein